MSSSDMTAMVIGIRFHASLVSEDYITVWTCVSSWLAMTPLSYAFWLWTEFSDHLFDGIFQGPGRESPREAYGKQWGWLLGEGPLGYFSICLDTLVDGHAQSSQHNGNYSEVRPSVQRASQLGR